MALPRSLFCGSQPLKNTMKKIKVLFLTLLLMLSMCFTVYAGDANQTVDNSSSSSGVTQGSSIVASSYGTYKVTLYFATKRIDNIEKASLSDFYQWGRPFIITNGIKGSAAGRTSNFNNTTSKLSQINGTEAPGLNAIRSTKDIPNLTTAGLPSWSNGSKLNDSGVRSFFAGKLNGGKNDPRFRTLNKLIELGAQQYIGGSSTGVSATKELIDRYKKLGVFSQDFLAAHPDMGYNDFIPDTAKWSVSWLVVMEPCFHFIPKNNSGKSFILTPTDGNLANAAVSKNYIIKNPFSKNKYNNWKVDGSYMIYSHLLEEGAGFQPDHAWLNGLIKPKPAGSKAFTGHNNTTPTDVVKYGGYSSYFYKANDEGTITVTPVYKGTDTVIPDAVVKEKEKKLPDGKGKTVYKYKKHGNYPFTGELIVKVGHDKNKKELVYKPVEDKVATVTPKIPSTEIKLEFEIPKISVIVVNKQTREVIPGATITEKHGYFDNRSSTSEAQIYYYGQEYGDYTYEASMNGQISVPVTVTVSKEKPNAEVILELDQPVVTPNSPNVIEENELTKGFQNMAIAFSSNAWNHNHENGCLGGHVACPGKPHSRRVGSGKKRRTVWYNCGALWSCSDYSAVIRPENYWNFNYLNSARPELAALHQLSASPAIDDGISLVFNKKENLSLSRKDLKDIYKDITSVSFIGHRSTEANYVQPLAAYMNGTEENKEFKDFIGKYIADYPSAFEKASAYTDKSYLLKYVTKEFNDVDGKVELTTSCSKASSPKYQSITGKIGSSNWEKTINVNKTYSAPAKSNPVEEYSLSYKDINYDYDKNGSSVEIRIPSEPITFYPAFQMDYAKSNSETTPNNKVWILADGKRTFNGLDFMKVKLTKNKLELSSQWSRDREDRYNANGSVSTTAVAKSGSMLKGDANGSTITIDVFYHVQDPAFCENQAAAQAKVDQITKTYTDAVNSMITKLKTDGTSFYSNLWDSTEENTLLKVQTPTSVQSKVNDTSLTTKTKMKVASQYDPKVSETTDVYYVDNNDNMQYSGSRNIKLGNGTFAIAGQWEDNGIINSTEKLSDLLITNASVQIQKKWYNETYEGVLVVHKRYVVKLDNLAFDYAQIHPYHSDFKTPVNETAKEIKFYYDDGQGSASKTLIKGDTFGVGMEFRLGNFTIQHPSKSYPVSNVFIASPPATFSIRGSIYDIK